jgi:hypothetical protein
MSTARKIIVALAGSALLLGSVAFVGSVAGAPQDKYAVKVPGGLAFSEFKGYESWETVAVSSNETATAVILGNPAMINAYKAGFPANGKPVPDGAKMAKIHWVPKKSAFFPNTTIPGAQHDVDFMVKDSKRFGDVGGWGYAVFRYDDTTKTFSPGTTADMPPQGNDAKCGVGCHNLAKKTDFVFTEYGHR